MAKTPIANFNFDEGGLETVLTVEVMNAFEIRDDLKKFGFWWDEKNQIWKLQKDFLHDEDLDKFTEELQKKLSDIGCELE